MNPSLALAVNIDDIEAARARIAGLVTHTPLLEVPALNALTGGRIYIKPECLQHTGSFKLRGASNRLALLTAQERRGGVVAFSSGNHAQGVAAAAARLGAPALIIMPSDAPGLKVERTRGHGAEVVHYDRAREDRETIAARYAAERGAVIVPPFNDPAIIAGQGTAALEAADDLAAAGVTPDAYLCCLGGGGLASGTALALKHRFPDCDIIGVEPEHYDDGARSLAAGERLAIAGYAPTLCDALQTPMLGSLTFPILQAVGARGLAVSQAQVVDAVRFAATEMKLVVEPGGAVALAALLAGLVDARDRSILIILSGGNIAPALLADIMDGAI